jgi:hypothetical protein
MIGTSISYWLNLQNEFDSLVAEFNSQNELIEERKVFEQLDYGYFRKNFGLKDYPRKKDDQIVELRKFLNVSTIKVLKNTDLAVSFRSKEQSMPENNMIKANAMVQTAVNIALKKETGRFNKIKFEEAVKYAVTLTSNHTGFYPLIKKAFAEAGVVFVVLPNLPGSKINGATKKIGHNIMLLVNDHGHSADSFWFTLFHEIGHIINGDFGISFEKEKGEKEEAADKFAENCLIPPEEYRRFLERGVFTTQSICEFAKLISRDPGIVLGRLQNDGKIDFNDWTMRNLKTKYVIQY